MQYIDKRLTMPIDVEKWVKKTKPTEWKLFSQQNYDGYKILREQLRLEQHGICCYCCQTLQEKAEIDHLQSRKNNHDVMYDYPNLLLSCKTSNQCNNAKGHQELPLTPLMQDCDSEIKINLAGELTASTPRASRAIDILKLNNANLCRKRQRKIDEIKFTFDPSKSDYPIDILDQATLKLIIESLGNTPEYYEFQYLLKKLT